MKVLMLGWEYPPHINGGLGTACQGLTGGLAGLGVDIEFVLPHVYGDEQVKHMQLSAANTPHVVHEEYVGAGEINTVKIKSFLRPYLRPTNEYEVISEDVDGHVVRRFRTDTWESGELFQEVTRYADLVAENFVNATYDVIHAHDWMTYPAAIALAQSSGRPFIAHVHSIEADRCGDGGNHAIAHIEYEGVQRATRVIAVSQYTKDRIVEHYKVDPAKIDVVHNGVTLRTYPKLKTERDPNLVLFLGRITFQKGPDYFIRAARQVIDRLPNARFAIAGDGDMLPYVKELTEQLGLSDKVTFHGFVNGPAVAKLYREASVYVMPSVSEPFGIAPLEAISNETPVIISKQSGVSEVIRHAMKIDFWDVDRLADYIENALQFVELREDLVSMSNREVQGLSWDKAGAKISHIYNSVG